ncbi:salicylate carboxymethyltransferase-like [Momordica charantia]|uniref:Salicylate carboxymethyltransferase-like n=1 Tax=Momordica charantia TaxID=3673 RepID=A0A6J1BWC5_MOMCH|nr:salicylate carboxymethyltransferase-like [Momordica charantia]
MLHVNGGRGDTSYASNSLLPQKVISMTRPIVKEAITNFFCRSTNFPTTLTTADLGCSSGSNTLMFVSDLIKQVEDIRHKFHKKPLEYQVFLNDLHGNDFNAIFTSLPSFVEDLKTQLGGGLGPCFFNGVPGSFYGRLFPTKSLHFVYSSYSLHWLSQVPKGIENNKGEIFMGSTSPKSVLEAYYKQFQKDFSMFLKSRAEELAIGGRMVLTMIGRTSEDSSSQEYCYVWGFLSLALNNMVAEGIVGAKKVDSFNIPNYMPSPSEMKGEILNEGSFTIDRLEVSRINWDFYDTESHQPNIFVDSGYYITQNIRSVIEPLLICHFGETIIEELFYRYRKIIDNHVSKNKIEFVNLTVSLSLK